MGNTLLREQNIEGREERAPLGVASYMLNIIGIVGNALVIHIFRTRFTSSSNYRIFVLSLALVDLFLCITHIPKELTRMILVYDQINDQNRYFCKIFHYIGNSVGLSSLFIVLFIGFERYRKICTPFKTQITMRRSKIMCFCAVIVSFGLDFPVYLIHGSRYVVVENRNATRCAVKNKYDGDLLPSLYYTFIFVVALIVLVFTIIFQVNILNTLAKKADSKKRMTSKIRTNKPECAIPDSNTEVPIRKILKKWKETKPEVKELAEQQEAEKNRRIAITFAIVTLLFMISFVSMTLFQTIEATRRYFVPKKELSKLEDVIEEYLPDIVTFNGILNPFVYFFTDVQFNKELKKICGRVG